MDKNTLSNYGWIVIAVLVLSVMIALATPFGKYVENGVRSTTAGLFETSEKAMNVVGMSAGEGEFGEGYSAPYNHNAPELNPNDNTGVYDGMIYTTENYEYCYGYVWCSWCEGWTYDWCCCDNYKITCDGWAVRCTKNIENPGPILESINGEPVTSLNSTFFLCTSLTTAPVIPQNVIDMNSTFANCKSLVKAPKIPNSITNMSGTFYNCFSLT